MKIKYLSLLFSLIFSNQFLFCMEPKPSSSDSAGALTMRRQQRKQEKKDNIEKLCRAILDGNDIAIESILNDIHYPFAALGQCLIKLSKQLTPELVNRFNRFNADMNYVDENNHNILELLALNGINVEPILGLGNNFLDDIPKDVIINHKKALIGALIIHDVEVRNAIEIAKVHGHADVAEAISKVLATKREVLCEGGSMILSTVLFYLFIASVIYSSYYNNQA